LDIRIFSKFEDPRLILRHSSTTHQTSSKYPTHIHEGYELILLKKGDISYIIQDKIFTLRKNSLVFTRPEQEHQIRPESDEAYDRYNILFFPEDFPPELLARIPPDLHVFQCDGNQLILGLFEKMDYYCRSLPPDAARRLLTAMIEELLWNIILQLEAPGPTQSRYKHPLTQGILECLEERLMEIDSMDSVCASLGISKSYLYQIFQEDLNTTPKAWLIQRRLKLARQEIFLGAKATAIYSFFGFQDYSAFYRAYKKQFGYAPSETVECAFKEDPAAGI